MTCKYIICNLSTEKLLTKCVQLMTLYVVQSNMSKFRSLNRFKEAKNIARYSALFSYSAHEATNSSELVSQFSNAVFKISSYI